MNIPMDPQRAEFIMIDAERGRVHDPVDVAALAESYLLALEALAEKSHTC